MSLRVGDVPEGARERLEEDASLPSQAAEPHAGVLLSVPYVSFVDREGPWALAKQRSLSVRSPFPSLQRSPTA
jgi:hypothetical protein